MSRRWCAFLAVALMVAAQPVNPRVLPRPEPVAEARLLMEGIAQPNFRGLEKLLESKPNSTDAWTFARGQALLIAETGNLLMIRPPNLGRAAWLDRAADLRGQAVRLARATADADRDRARAELTRLAVSCNRCHETFRVTLRVTAFGELPREQGARSVP